MLSRTMKQDVIVTLQKVDDGFQVIENPKQTRSREHPNSDRVTVPTNSDSNGFMRNRMNLTPQLKKTRIALQQAPQPFDQPTRTEKPQESSKVLFTSQPKDWFLQNWDLVLPASARWFKIEQIHVIEREALPEFFSTEFHNDYSYQKGNYKTPQSYLKKRNQIIQKWISTQIKYLKFTDCISFIGGDASSLLRIYTFLEHWGLINFQYQSTNLPNQGYVYQLNETFLERIKVNFQNNTSINFHSSMQPMCDVCGNTSTQIYHQRKETLAKFQINHLIICSSCHNQNIFPGFLKEEDFVLQHQTKQQVWTNEDLLKLIELVYKYKERWNEIAKHFNRKSLSEIVRTYLQLPYSSLFSYVKPIRHYTKPQKEAITFHNDMSNPIQMGAATFKQQLDQLKVQETEEVTQSKAQEIDQILKDMIDNQTEKIKLKLGFLDEFEHCIDSEKSHLALRSKESLSLLVQLQTMSDQLIL